MSLPVSSGSLQMKVVGVRDELVSTESGHEVQNSDFSNGLRERFVIKCEVLFENFETNYPMIASTANNSFQMHGLGDAYHEDKGKLVFYLYTTSGKGPHGRGTGQVRSVQKLSPNEWHEVTVEKGIDFLSVEVDGQQNKRKLPEEFQPEDFIMKPTGNLILTGANSPDKRLNGRVRNFMLLPPSVMKSARK